MTDPRIAEGMKLVPELERLDAEIKKTWAFWTALYGDKFDEEGNKTAQRQYEYACHSFACERNRQTIITALTAAGEMAGENWRDDPAMDERWNEGVDFAQLQLCAVLKVDPKSISWDAATETLDGDVQSVTGKILDAGLGNDDWRSAAPASPVGEDVVEKVAIAIHLSEFPNWPWVDVEAILRNRLRVKARAALAAITNGRPLI